jgi:hypothetical protein
MPNEENLIPEIKEWQKLNGVDFTIENWIANEGNIKLAIGYSSIFWPAFIEHENCVFLKSHFTLEGYNSWKSADYVEYFSQIEYVINHIHILDLFLREREHGQEITKDQLIYLGNTLREIYEIKLSKEFVERTFVVTFNGQEDLDDLIDYELSFHQLENETKRVITG